MLKTIIVASLVAGLAGCAIPPKAVTYTISAPFDEQAAAAQMQPGSGALHGNAFMRQKGGGVVTCAGADVSLIPVTGYATERLSRIYGQAPAENEVSAVDIRTALSTRIEFSPDVPAYKEFMHKTKCDGQGEFDFSDLKDGSYYVTTYVVWEVGALRQGGFLATQTKVRNGEVSKIIMSR